MNRLRAAFARSPRSVAFAAGIAVLLAHTAWIQPWVIDDTFIHLRYAQNFAAGEGFVYNVGERVEGYTSFLWVLMLGLGGALGLPGLPLAQGLGLAFAAATLALLAAADRFVPGVDRRDAGVATLLLAACGPFAVWAAAGMETPLVAVLALVLFLLHGFALRAPRQLARVIAVGVCGALGVMARPDFAVLLAAVGLARVCEDLRAGRRTFVFVGLAFALVYGPYYAWRFAWYGYALPNTFYAKVGASGAQGLRGAAYAADFAWAILPLAGLALALLWKRARADAGTPSLALLAMIAAHALYVVAVGGDSMPAFRFFVTVLPLLVLAAALGLRRLGSSAAVRRAALALTLVFLLTQTFLHPQLVRGVRDARVAQIGAEVGRWLARSMPADTLIAVNAAGAIAYYSGFRVIDTLGLNDAHIAHREMPRMGKGLAGHEKGDGAYVLERAPDLIQFGPSWGSAGPIFVGDRELQRMPDFRRRYTQATYVLPSGRAVLFYRRVD